VNYSAVLDSATRSGELARFSVASRTVFAMGPALTEIGSGSAARMRARNRTPAVAPPRGWNEKRDPQLLDGLAADKPGGAEASRRVYRLSSESHFLQVGMKAEGQMTVPKSNTFQVLPGWRMGAHAFSARLPGCGGFSQNKTKERKDLKIGGWDGSKAVEEMARILVSLGVPLWLNCTGRNAPDRTGQNGTTGSRGLRLNS
jgi:hypothetical protein